ncbi:MAG: PilZ domain-containing protein [Marinobacter sp.]|nr:PilZ domain-containing protein [Marinobacter sp.]
MPEAPSNGSVSDRRDFFRIQDRIGLEVRKLEPGHSSLSDPFNEGHLDGLRDEMRRLDQDIKLHLASLAEKDRLLTTLIKSLNGKLDTLARIMAFEQNPLQQEQWQDVTLSEGGIAFRTATNIYHPGDRLAVRMTLPPELFRPMAIAEVLKSEPDSQGGSAVHTQFTTIQDADRQQIARHVMRWQVRQRQST